MPNVMAALPNIGSVLCSTPQSLVDIQSATAEIRRGKKKERRRRRRKKPQGKNIMACPVP